MGILKTMEDKRQNGFITKRKKKIKQTAIAVEAETLSVLCGLCLDNEDIYVAIGLCLSILLCK